MTSTDLETRFNWVSLALLASFGVAFAAGLILHVRRPGSPAASFVLHTGLVLLMAAPAAKLLIALSERIRTRDWTFVVMTLIVVAELAIVMWRASTRS